MEKRKYRNENICWGDVCVEEKRREEKRREEGVKENKKWRRRRKIRVGRLNCDAPK